MKKVQELLILLLLVISFNSFSQAKKSKFIHVEGKNLYTPNNEEFFIKGTNLGNWLNPEGYMFFFDGNASSFRLINQAFCEMVGEDFTAKFWQQFQKNYITREDIFYIKSTGMNTIRIPFHYKLFTDEDYMGETGENTDEWVEKFRITLEENNMGWTYWPYKKWFPKVE